MEQLLILLSDSTADPECVGMLLEFIHSLVKLQINGLYILNPRLVTIAMHWLTEKSACTQSLLLIRSVAMDARHGAGDAGSVDVRQNILEQLDQGLKLLLKTVQDGSSLDSESRTQITALLKLLQEMIRTPALRQKVLQNVHPEAMQKIFHPLFSLELHKGDNLFEAEVTALFVQALDIMSDLTAHDAKWLKLYSELLQYKQLQMVLAVALYMGKEDIKRQVLTLTGTIGFPAERFDLKLLQSELHSIPYHISPVYATCNKFKFCTHVLSSECKRYRADHVLALILNLEIFAGQLCFLQTVYILIEV